MSDAGNPPTGKPGGVDTNYLLDRLWSEGGAIVAANRCSEDEIKKAASANRLNYSANGVPQFVRRPEVWIAHMEGKDTDTGQDGSSGNQ